MVTEKTRIVSLDLSSKCIGVIIAEIHFTDQKGNYVLVKSLPIIPKKITGLDLGYTSKKAKKLANLGNEFLGFLKPNETSITKKKAEERNREFKSIVHNRLLRDIGQQIGRILGAVQPNELLIERNESFNGILTTKLLAEIAGGIYFYAGANNIEMFDYNQSRVRSFIRKNIKDFTYENEHGLEAIDTKWEIFCRLRSVFSEHIDFTKITLDESDSLAVLYYHVEKGRHK